MKKILLMLLCVATVLGAASCTKDPDGNPQQSGTTAQTQAPLIEAVSPYQSVIDAYCALMLAKSQGETLAEPDETASEIELAIYEIARDCRAPAMMGYATKDINGDGTEELVLLHKHSVLYALLTLQNGAPALLWKYDGTPAAITPDGTVYISQYVKDQFERTHLKKIVDGRLEGLEFGTEGMGDTASNYKIENGVRSEITQDELFALRQTVQLFIFHTDYYTKTVGFRFVPAIASEPQNPSPAADFSSYDGILSAYGTIVECFSDYSQSDWISGEYDDMFSISSNADYDIFHHLFYYGIGMMPKETYFGSTYRKDGKNAFGYARRDLNGDGTEELILLTDLYEILAVFTVKDGKAVFLKDTAGAWIGEDGLLRKENSTGGTFDRDGEVFVWELRDGALQSRIALGYVVGLYLQKEGWYRIEGNSKIALSKEEGEALYAQYDVLPKGYCNEEYTKAYASLAFVPLFDRTVATDGHVNTFTNIRFISSHSLTVSAVKGDTVDFTLRFVVVEGEGANAVAHEIPIQASATLENGVYVFEKDGVKGHLIFSPSAVWAVVTESENGQISCRPYLFDRPEN